MLQRTTQLQVFAEIVLPIDAEHRLSFLRKVGVALQRNVNVCPRIDNTLVQNSHLTSRVVNRVIGILGQPNAASRHHNRPLRHVVGSQGDDVGRRTPELSHQHILVFLGDLLGYGLGRIVQLGESIPLGFLLIHAFAHQIAMDIRPKRFCHGEEHTAIAHRITLHKVKITVAMRLVVVIQSVGTQQSYDGLVFHLRLGNIGKINAGGITLELHIQAKLLALHPTGQLVHVLHHQSPVALSWVVAGVFERLDKQRRIHIGHVTGKLAHLIGGTTISIFVCYGQHLVGLQSHAQRNVSQCRVNRVFRGI